MTFDTQNLRYSIADYLARERLSRDKHEYRDGQILLMAGGTVNHSLVIANVISALHNRLTGKPCNVFDSNLRVRIPRTILYTYPDASVICGPRELDPNDDQGETVTNPKLIVEVLSPSTEAYDRGEKFARYRQLDSLEEYVLVSLIIPRIETFSRRPSAPSVKPSDTESTWLIATASGINAHVKLHSLDMSLPLVDVYRGVDFPPPAADS